MKWSIAGLLVMGLVAALSATFLVTALIAEMQRTTEVQVEPTHEVEVLVAREDLAVNTMVRQEHVTRRNVLVSALPPNYLSDAVQVVGRVLAEPMTEGQAFNSSLFAQGKGIHLAASLPDGGRAMTVSLTTASGLEGLLYPGSIVDVVASFRPPTVDNQRSQAVPTVLVQGISVLAVEQRTVVSNEDRVQSDGRLPGRSRLVTLLVNAEQAKALQLAQEYGSITLVMRNPMDANVMPGGVTMLSDLAVYEASYAPTADQFLAAFDQSQGRMLASIEQIMTDQRVAQADAAPSTAMAEDALPTEPAHAAAEPLPPWKTTIIRGNRVETRLFDLPEEGSGESAIASP